MDNMTNYSKMYASPDEAPIRNDIVGLVVNEPDVVDVQDEPAKEPETITGIVVDCNSLNVREEPSRKANVLTILMAGTEVQVAADEMLDEWYHVYTASGLDGFCMKKYIAFKE